MPARSPAGLKGRRFSRLPWLLLPLALVLAPPPASAQSFGAETIGHRTYVAGTAIIPLALPVATGNPVYTLPNLPAGLSFAPVTRVLSGTPSTPTAVAAYTYTATSGVNSASLTFRLAVIPANAATDGFIVSNLDEAEGSSNAASGFTLSAFTTGANAGGYTMTGAVIRLAGNSSGLTSVSIYSGPSIDALHGTLALDGLTSDLPASGDLTFTSTAGIPLASSTTYYLALRGFIFVRLTSSFSQTSFDGWGIGNDVFRFDPGNNQFSLYASNSALQYSISASPVNMLTFIPPTIADQTWAAGVPQALTLPPAPGGSGSKTYTLMPALPSGLSFSGRVLSGTPSMATAAAAYTYTATDSSGNTTHLNFTLTLTERLPAPANLSATPFNGGVSLSWDAPSGIGVTYEYRQNTGVSGYTDWVGTGASPLGVSGLSGCTRFQVRARYGSVLGDASEEVTAPPLGASCSINLRLRIFLEGPLR